MATWRRSSSLFRRPPRRVSGERLQSSRAGRRQHVDSYRRPPVTDNSRIGRLVSVTGQVPRLVWMSTGRRVARGCDGDAGSVGVRVGEPTSPISYGRLGSRERAGSAHFWSGSYRTRAVVRSALVAAMMAVLLVQRCRCRCRCRSCRQVPGRRRSARSNACPQDVGVLTLADPSARLHTGQLEMSELGSCHP
jgi:hypothetical protein